MDLGYDQATEQRLIRQAAAGDRASSEQLIKAYQNGVYCFIYRMCGKRDVAEDIVQEAFVRVLMNLDRFDPKFRFSTWLFTIARRVYLNYAEKRRPVYVTDGLADLPNAVVTHHDSVAGFDEHAWERSKIDAALAKLPAEQREIVVLCHQHDWPLALVAEHMGMPVGTIKSQLFRGRMRLRDTLMAMRNAETREAEQTGRGVADHVAGQGSDRARMVESKPLSGSGQGSARGLDQSGAGGRVVQVGQKKVGVPRE